MTLREWLRREKITLDELAARVDDTCTQSLASKWVRGLVMPSHQRALAIERITGGEVTWRGMWAHVRRTRAASKARGARFRADGGIE